jgi:hypothetical protein
MDHLAQHQDPLQRLATEFDARQPAGEQLEAAEGSQDVLEDGRQQQHFEQAN